MEIINCAQNSPEWYAARCGVITASNFKSVLAKGEGKTRATYMRKLAAERIRGVANDSFSNAYTERGHEFEEVACELYTKNTGNPTIKCGFIKEGNVGYSPDVLIGNDGLGEIKTRNGDLQIELILADKVPTEHKAQVQGGLLVSGRKWIDFVSYCSGMPLFIRRVERDEDYISNLKTELISFENELQELIEIILNKF